MKTFKMLRTAAITGYIVLAVVLFSSCETDKGKEQFDKRYWELKTATMELEYLEKLYKVREDISFREKIRVLDSIYMDWKLKSCGLDSLNNR